MVKLTQGEIYFNTEIVIIDKVRRFIIMSKFKYQEIIITVNIYMHLKRNPEMHVESLSSC